LGKALAGVGDIAGITFSESFAGGAGLLAELPAVVLSSCRAPQALNDSAARAIPTTINVADFLPLPLSVFFIFNACLA